MIDFRSQVRDRAAHRCEYCRMPQALFRRQFHIEHIVAKQHGGQTQLENLSLACWQCNLKKGPNLSAIDIETGQLTRLFHPRNDNWVEHFAFNGSVIKEHHVEIAGLTPVGRATSRLLGMNEELRQVLRWEYQRQNFLLDYGRYG